MLAAACAVVAAAAVMFTWRIAPYPWWVWLPIHLAGSSFAMSGVVLWRRRPTNPTGRLMVAAGITWYIGDLQLTGESLLFALGFCGYHLSYAILGHLVLALPTGRLRNRHERWVVAAGYTTQPITQIARYVTEYPPQPQSWGNPHAAYSPWAGVGSVAMLVLTLLTIVLLIRRWSAAGKPLRREYALVWLTIVTMGSVAAINTITALLHASVTVQQYLQLAFTLGLVGTPVALAAGLLRVRMARMCVADLVLRLSDRTEPEQVRNAVADAVGDPKLDVWFPLLDGTGYVRTDGRTVDQLPPDHRAVTPVLRGGEPLAFVVHDPALRNQRSLVDSVLAAASLAMDNARLVAAQRAHVEDLRASRSRIVVAGDAERRRIQRDLHDGIQQKLLVVSMLMAQANERPNNPKATPPTGPAEALATGAAQLHEVIHELRALTEGIHPAALAEQGLAAAVETLAERAPLPVLADVAARRWPDQLERAAYFLVNEALANVYKHAHAASVRVRVDGHADRLLVEVTDDGVGGADPARGTGLRGLHDRISALNGTLRVVSPLGRGTRLVAELPCGP
jgi:signal transduction histidine kinase